MRWNNLSTPKFNRLVVISESTKQYKQLLFSHRNQGKIVMFSKTTLWHEIFKAAYLTKTLDVTPVVSPVIINPDFYRSVGLTPLRLHQTYVLQLWVIEPSHCADLCPEAAYLAQNPGILINGEATFFAIKLFFLLVGILLRI